MENERGIKDRLKGVRHGTRQGALLLVMSYVIRWDERMSFLSCRPVGPFRPLNIGVCERRRSVANLF